MTGLLKCQKITRENIYILYPSPYTWNKIYYTPAKNIKKYII